MGPLTSDDLPQIQLEDHWGFVGRIVADEPENVLIVRCRMEPDGGAHEHVHEDRDHLFVLIEGGLHLTVGDEAPFRAEAGELVHIPAGVPHAVRNDQLRDAVYVTITYRTRDA